MRYERIQRSSRGVLTSTSGFVRIRLHDLFFNFFPDFLASYSSLLGFFSYIQCDSRLVALFHSSLASGGLETLIRERHSYSSIDPGG